VQRVSHSQRDIGTGEQILSEIDAKDILSSLCVVVNPKSVTVRQIPEGKQHGVNVRDVLVGPLNLFV
jgi:hypothetical protein